MSPTALDRLGVVIELVALTPYRHWNFKPAAEDMCALLFLFRRDVTSRCGSTPRADCQQ